jgi:charged multivesicular body protein 2A
MAQAMKGVTKALVKMNKKVNLPGMQKIMAEFMKENERSEMTQEMIGDVIDDALEEDGSAEEEASVVNQVLDELGVSAIDPALAAPLGGGEAVKGGAATEQKAPEDPAMSEIEARLNKLKN